MITANEGIKKLFRAYAEVDCKREIICRALMLLAYENDEQSQIADLTIRNVYSTVNKILEPLINYTKLDVFRTELRDLFKEAVTL
jgi:DNA-binding SARP family transcriptional activator